MNDTVVSTKLPRGNRMTVCYQKIRPYGTAGKWYDGMFEMCSIFAGKKHRHNQRALNCNEKKHIEACEEKSDKTEIFQ
jgi:hypothetical protein